MHSIIESLQTYRQDQDDIHNMRINVKTSQKKRLKEREKINWIFSSLLFSGNLSATDKAMLRNQVELHFLLSYFFGVKICYLGQCGVQFVQNVEGIQIQLLDLLKIHERWKEIACHSKMGLIREHWWLIALNK